VFGQVVDDQVDDLDLVGGQRAAMRRAVALITARYQNPAT
jgi:hypothetical protein